MTWEETIQMINKDPNYSELVRDAYISNDLPDNIERFRNSPEFKETLILIKKYAPLAKNILDIGCGNGISAISFALCGYKVLALEPNPSNLAGYGAIQKMIAHYHLDTVKIEKSFAEEYKASETIFDVVYARQSMHHAANLNHFVKNSTRDLKKGGLWISVRDHVIFNEKDKNLFFQNHPLHKFYGGENAFKPDEYKSAIRAGGFKIVKELKYYDSVINYFPTTKDEIEKRKKEIVLIRKKSLQKKIGALSKIGFLYQIYNYFLNFKLGNVLDEKQIPGRIYTYIALKK